MKTSLLFEIWENDIDALAHDLREKKKTIQQWVYRENTPSKVWPKIYAKALERGRRLTLQDFGIAN
jgi:hypothetical protein